MGIEPRGKIVVIINNLVISRKANRMKISFLKIDGFTSLSSAMTVLCQAVFHLPGAAITRQPWKYEYDDHSRYMAQPSESFYFVNIDYD